MGISLFSNSDYSPPNPNPLKYSVITKVFIGRLEIVEVSYSGCTTFNGRKLLLLRRHHVVLSQSTNGYGETCFPSHVIQLDPHLLGEDHIVMARFEPTDEGWRLARMCADNIIAEEYNE